MQKRPSAKGDVRPPLSPKNTDLAYSFWSAHSKTLTPFLFGSFDY